MTTKEEIILRRGQLEAEKLKLESEHAKMVSEFQTRQNQFQLNVSANQMRFQQITGAVAELTEVLNKLNGETDVNPT